MEGGQNCGTSRSFLGKYFIFSRNERNLPRHGTMVTNQTKEVGADIETIRASGYFDVAI